MLKSAGNTEMSDCYITPETGAAFIDKEDGFEYFVIGVHDLFEVMCSEEIDLLKAYKILKRYGVYPYCLTFIGFHPDEVNMN